MRLLLTGNFTLEPLGKLLTGHEVSFAPFGQYRAVLSGQRPEILSNMEGVVVLIDGFELASEGGWFFESIANVALEYARLVLQFAQTNTQLLVFGSAFKLPSVWPQSFSATIDPVGPHHIESQCNEILDEGSRRLSNLSILDMGSVLAYVGENASYNDGMRYFARYGFTPAFGIVLTDRLKQIINAVSQPAKKVLAVDFDDTLWGGIVGETGPLGVELSQDGPGRAFRHFQMLIKQLGHRGVLIVGLTRNNQSDIDELFDKNDMMVLKKADFALIYANWDNKAKNICNAAEALNLNLDSFVFIDNSPFERGSVRETCIEVTVPEVPEAVDARPRWLLENVIPSYFPCYRVTQEDSAKVQQYRANALRAGLKDQLSIEEYIDSLGIVLEFRVNDTDDVVRISQLTQKTNQFNLTSRRYSVGDVERMMRSGDYDVIGMRYEDRYGKEGLIGLGILNVTANCIDTFLMSCRVIGRTVERSLMLRVEVQAKERGIIALDASFGPTSKNGVARDFLESQGYQQILTESSAEKHYRKRLT